MKKYILLVLISLFAFSCTDNDPEKDKDIKPTNSKGLSGVYLSSFTPILDFPDYLPLLPLVLEKKSDSIYYVATYIVIGGFYSPVTQFEVYNGDKIRGEFKIYDRKHSKWLDASLEGVVTKDSIYGLFSGLRYVANPVYLPSYYDTIRDGTFVFKYDNIYSQPGNLPPLPQEMKTP